MRNKFALIFLLFLLAAVAGAQVKNKYNYLSQKKFIPAELGKVYLGMPLADFAKQINLKAAEVSENRFEWLEVSLPLAKGNVERIDFKVHGLEAADYAKLLYKETVTKKGDFGDYKLEVQKIDTSKIPAKGLVYEISLHYKKDFDLKKHVVKMFGATKDVYKKGDQYHLYDMQWTKKTADGLVWLVRYYEETKALMLAGRIAKTEWDPGV